jgi:succinate--hydroxymethylglutarate CoA-transferase
MECVSRGVIRITSINTRKRITSYGLQAYRAQLLVRPKLTRQLQSSTKNVTHPEDAPNSALSGVKILDLSRVLAAPLCTQILADYGADVIKVEDVSRGDDTRYFKAEGEEALWKPDIGPMSDYFAAVNRNKRAITLNLKHERGIEIFMQLVKEADVLVENYRTGTMEKLGIGFDVLSKANSMLIHASISGYGPTGPMAKRAGYDMIAGAEAGLLHLTGERGGPPVRPGLGIVDISTGLYSHGAILAALLARQRTGCGQKIDASLFETQIALLINVGHTWLNMGIEAERWGTQHPSVVPYDAFKTKDLYFVTGATNDKQFAIFTKQLGKPELASDERFKTNDDRVKNRNELYPILKPLFLQKTTAELMDLFEGTGMPYGPINTMEKVFNHPQTEARDMVHEMEFAASTKGRIRVLGPPVKFSDTKATIRTRAPLHSEHTEEVLGELGISKEEIGKLKEAGTV